MALGALRRACCADDYSERGWRSLNGGRAVVCGRAGAAAPASCAPGAALEPRLFDEIGEPHQRRIRPDPRNPVRETVEVQIPALAPAGQHRIETRIDRQAMHEHKS